MASVDSYPLGRSPGRFLASAGVGLVGLAAGIGVGGCSHPVRIGRSRTVQIALTEYRVRPGNVIAPPGTLTFEVRNVGQLSHNLVVAQGTTVMGATQAIPPGQTATIAVTLTPGRYSMSSSIQSDGTLGDRGTLTITR